MRIQNISNVNYETFTDTINIICVEKIDEINPVISSSIVILEIYINSCIKFLNIKFDWRFFTEELDESNFLLIPETKMIFFRTSNQWGVIDFQNLNLFRHEYSFDLPLITKNKNFILIENDLYAESTNLNGEKIDNVPIDPPTEKQVFEDRIVYNSPIFGVQTLKIN